MKKPIKNIILIGELVQSISLQFVYGLEDYYDVWTEV